MSKQPFQVIIQALADTSTAFPSRYLNRFSDLSSADLALLMQKWPELPKNRKRTLLNKLVELYQADTLLSFEVLAIALLTDPDEQICADALRLLVDTDNTHILPRLLELLEQQSSVLVQAHAAQVLGSFVELGELEEISAETRQMVEDALLKASGSEHADVQRAALESLGYSSRADVGPLIQAAYTRHDPRWVATALSAMGRSANAQWEELILAKMDDPHNEIRRNAVQAAGELRLEAARQFLINLLDEEEDDEVFGSAIWSLSQIGGEDVRVTLETLLDQVEDDDLSELIEEALANLDFTEELNSFDLLSLDPDDPEEK